jgi:hypothetical protein
MAPTIAELITRTLFFATTIAALVLMPWGFRLGVIVLALIRYFIVMFVVVRNARRLGEIALAPLHGIYDIIEPLLRLCIALGSRSKSKKSWE